MNYLFWKKFYCNMKRKTVFKHIADDIKWVKYFSTNSEQFLKFKDEYKSKLRRKIKTCYECLSSMFYRQKLKKNKFENHALDVRSLGKYLCKFLCHIRRMSFYERLLFSSDQLELKILNQIYQLEIKYTKFLC